MMNLRPLRVRSIFVVIVMAIAVSCLAARDDAARVDVGEDKFELVLDVNVRVMLEHRREEDDGVNEALAILGREEVSHRVLFLV